MFLRTGYTYDIRYRFRKVDEYPRLFVLRHDSVHTAGINLHYFPSIRRNSAYKQIPINLWEAIQTNIKERPQYKPVFDLIERYNDPKLQWSQAQNDIFLTLLKRINGGIYMGAYRNYMNEGIVIVREVGKGLGNA